MWKALVAHPIVTVVVAAIVGSFATAILTPYFNPPRAAQIKPEIAYNTGKPFNGVGSFKLDPSVDPEPWFSLSVENIGTAHDDEVQVVVSFTANKITDKVSKKYVPGALRERVKNSKETETSFQELFYVFPAKAAVQYRVKLKRFVQKDTDYDFSVLSKDANWSKERTFKLSRSYYFHQFFNIATAEEKMPDGKTTAPSRSGISLGGYDPIVLSNGLFNLVQQKGLIGKNDATEIKKAAETPGGVLFGGVNILQFNEVLINKLISNRAITYSQAEQALDKSRKAGGVLVGGVNIVVLEVEVMNALLMNRHIQQWEGQKIIDGAKGPYE